MMMVATTNPLQRQEKEDTSGGEEEDDDDEDDTVSSLLQNLMDDIVEDDFEESMEDEDIDLRLDNIAGIADEDVHHLSDDDDDRRSYVTILQEYAQDCLDAPIGRLSSVGGGSNNRMVEMIDIHTAIRDLSDFIKDKQKQRLQMRLNYEQHDESTTDGEEKEMERLHAELVESLLYRLLDEWNSLSYETNGGGDGSSSSSSSLKEDEFQPMPEDFEYAIKAWYKSTDPDRVDHVLRLVDDLHEVFLVFDDDEEDEDGSSFKPTIATFEVVLQTIETATNERSSSRRHGRGSDTLEEHAQQVFDSITNIEGYGLTPTPQAYASMVKIISKTRSGFQRNDRDNNRGRRGDNRRYQQNNSMDLHLSPAYRAEQLLREAVDVFLLDPPDGSNNNNNNLKKYDTSALSTDVFNSVVLSYAKSNLEDGPQRAQDLIVYMSNLDLPQCEPNSKTFTTLIDAYAQMNEWESVFEAERILNNLLDQYLKEGRQDLEPNVATWTIVISAWARLSRKSRRGACDNAGKLLRRMEALNEQGRITARPDAITYVTCMNAYAYTKTPKSLREAQSILDEMNERYLDGDDTMKPSLKSIKILLDGWIKAGNMNQAEEILDTYEDILDEESSKLKGSQSSSSSFSSNSNSRSKETTLGDIYQSMLLGYTQAQDPRRASVYLEMMVDEDGMEPDAMCYERIIDGYARQIESIGKEDTTKNNVSSAAKLLKQAQSIFEMFEKRRGAGVVTPTERVFTTFIRALGKSRTSNLHKKAELIFRRVQSLDEQGTYGDNMAPTTHTYNAVLKACAECSEDPENTSLDEAFQTAVRIFTELRKSRCCRGPDYVTFGNMIQCANLLPVDGGGEKDTSPKRDKFITATFNLCCDYGLVNSWVLRDLQSVATEALWQDLTGIDASQIETMQREHDDQVNHKDTEDDTEIGVNQPFIRKYNVMDHVMEQLPREWSASIHRKKPRGDERAQTSPRQQRRFNSNGQGRRFS